MSERKENIEITKEKSETLLRSGNKSIKLLFFVSLVIVLALVDVVVNNFKGIGIYAMLGILIILDLLLLIHLKNIALRQNLLRIENENISDQIERTKFGILKLVTGEKIESTFIIPKYKTSDYIDKTNNATYHSDKVVGFQILEKNNATQIGY